MLPMLTVSGAPGIVYLNGIFCGETGQAALPVNARGVQYLELRPFDAEVPPAVLRLTFEDGRLTGGAAGDAFAVQWPDGRVEIELRAPAAAAAPAGSPPDTAPRRAAPPRSPGWDHARRIRSSSPGHRPPCPRIPPHTPARPPGGTSAHPPGR